MESSKKGAEVVVRRPLNWLLEPGRQGPVEDGHVSDDLEEGAPGGLGNLFRKGALFFLEGGELDFDEAVQG